MPRQGDLTTTANHAVRHLDELERVLLVAFPDEAAVRGHLCRLSVGRHRAAAVGHERRKHDRALERAGGRDGTTGGGGGPGGARRAGAASLLDLHRPAPELVRGGAVAAARAGRVEGLEAINVEVTHPRPVHGRGAEGVATLVEERLVEAAAGERAGVVEARVSSVAGGSGSSTITATRGDRRHVVEGRREIARGGGVLAEGLGREERQEEEVKGVHVESAHRDEEGGEEEGVPTPTLDGHGDTETHREAEKLQ